MSPTVFYKNNIRFFFFSLEEDRMHIHVSQAGKKAKFWIEPSIELDNSYGFNLKELKLIEQEIINNESAIREKWNSHHNG